MEQARQRLILPDLAATRALARHNEMSADAGGPALALAASPVRAGSTIAPPRPVAAVAITLGLAALGLAALLVSLIPSRTYLRAASAAHSPVLADFAHRLASSRGEVGLTGVAVLAVVGIAFLLAGP